MTWLEDIPLGHTQDLGVHTFTEPGMLAFARKYDPMPFLTDLGAAKDGPHGGLVASGWYICAIWMKLMIASRANAPKEISKPAPDGRMPPQGGPSPGFLDLKWRHPVRPGDTLAYKTTTIEKIDMKSRPTHGIVRVRNEAVNQNGEIVMSFTGQGMIERMTPLSQPPGGGK